MAARQLIRNNGKVTKRSKVVDLAVARKWMDAMEAHWRDSLLTADEIAARKAVSSFPMNQAASVDRIDADNLKIVNTEGLVIELSNVIVAGSISI